MTSNSTEAFKAAPGGGSLREKYAGGRWRQFLQLDECDQHLLETHVLEIKWRRPNYPRIVAYPRPTVRRPRKIALARLILNIPDDAVPDHINGDTLDNRRCNLRIATHNENSRNRRSFSPQGYRGISLHKGKWRARIMVNGQNYGRGVFLHKEGAAREYDRLARLHHGEFAVLNFPDEVSPAQDGSQSGGGNTPRPVSGHTSDRFAPQQHAFASAGGAEC